MANSTNILILGGTRSARDLAILLNAHGHINVLTSLAGRTQEPDRTFGKTRIGGFGGAQGLAKYLEDNAIDLLVDSTHPFAIQISSNALTACKSADVAHVVFDRPQWEKQPDDDWIDCDDIDEAANHLPSGAVAFLALGHQYLDRFSHRKDVRFIARMIDEPKGNVPLPNHELVIAKPSHIAKEEADLFIRHSVTHLISRNSGGTLIYAKIEAARDLSLPVLMIKRPPKPTGLCIDNIEDIAAHIIQFSA